MFTGESMNGRGCFGEAATAGWTRRLRIDAADAMTGREQRPEHRHGEFGRAHEHDVEAHAALPEQSPMPAGDQILAERSCFLKRRSTMSRFKRDRKSMIRRPSR